MASENPKDTITGPQWLINQHYVSDVSEGMLLIRRGFKLLASFESRRWPIEVALVLTANVGGSVGVRQLSRGTSRRCRGVACD